MTYKIKTDLISKMAIVQMAKSRTECSKQRGGETDFGKLLVDVVY